jgi:hypothetical protein
MIMRQKVHFGHGILLTLAVPVCTYSQTVIIENVPMGYSGTIANVKVTVKDANGQPVPNAWVRGQNKDDGRPFLGPTNANGVYEGPVQHVQSLPIWENDKAVIVDCKTALESVSGHTLTFNAATGTLSITQDTVQRVSYQDMTSTTVNTPTETIIGASVHLSDMHFNGFNSFGEASFGNATLTIANSSGTYLTAAYNNILVGSFPGLDTSVLIGDTSSFALNNGLNSRYINEFGQDLATLPNPNYFLNIGGDLAALTNNFTTDASVSEITDFLGGSSSIPEPSSLILLLVGVTCTLVRRRGQALRH